MISDFNTWRHSEIGAMRFPVPLAGEPSERELPKEPSERDAAMGEIAEQRYWRFVTDWRYRQDCEDEWRAAWTRGAKSA